ncbi:hypothetical protein [Faecalicatena contorta]|uniref:hypothetical protein n=1 Tax=Faecalicatena contorta TaxID=39482 RepID=UPI001F366BAA|nr:hypothetical protein [Faecalicatena contorta]MCF2681825.1 hypothetical protein [Faecalicatena contorta]
MNWTIYIIECCVLIILFTGLIMIPLIRNPIWWIHDYPKDIQEAYFENHERIPTQAFSIPVLLKKSFALLLALAILSVLVVWAGAKDFASAFLASYGMWLLIDWYDCFFLDWVLFANIRCIRLPGTEHMDQAYHQKKYHVIHSFIGMALGVIPCLLTGCCIMAVY